MRTIARNNPTIAVFLITLASWFQLPLEPEETRNIPTSRAGLRLPRKGCEKESFRPRDRAEAVMARRICLALLLATSIVVLWLSTLRAASAAEPVCTRSDVFVCEDWETNPGQGNGTWFEWVEAGGPSARVDQTFGYNSSRSLKYVIHSDTCSPTPCFAEANYSGFALRSITPQTPPAVVHIRWYNFFSAGFTFVPGGAGGKMFIWRARPNPNVLDWRTVGLFAPGNGADKTVTYLLHDYSFSVPPLSPNITTTLIQSGRWYVFEYMIKINTPGVSNGEAKWWVDGVLQGSYTGLDHNVGTSTPINSLAMDAYFGGIETNPRPEQYIWMDNIVMANSYIGPISTTTSPPTAPANLRLIEMLRRLFGSVLVNY